MGVIVSLRPSRIARGQRIFGVNSPRRCVNATAGLAAVQNRNLWPLALPGFERSLHGHPARTLETVLRSARINKTDVAA